MLWRQSVSGVAPPQPLPLGESAEGLLPPNALNTAVAVARRGNRLAYTKSISDTNIGRVSLTDDREPPAPFIISTRPDLCCRPTTCRPSSEASKAFFEPLADDSVTSGELPHRMIDTILSSPGELGEALIRNPGGIRR